MMAIKPSHEIIKLRGERKKQAANKENAIKKEIPTSPKNKSRHLTEKPVFNK